MVLFFCRWRKPRQPSWFSKYRNLWGSGLSRDKFRGDLWSHAMLVPWHDTGECEFTWRKMAPLINFTGFAGQKIFRGWVNYPSLLIGRFLFQTLLEGCIRQGKNKNLRTEDKVLSMPTIGPSFWIYRFENLDRSRPQTGTNTNPPELMESIYCRYVRGYYQDG